METKLNFKSAICTSREQSEKLLALGLKKETADMIHSLKQTSQIGDWFILPRYHGDNRYSKETIPAWSLHRLILLCKYNDNGFATLIPREGTYDYLIESIAHRIKEGYFNKEYLNGND